MFCFLGNDERFSSWKKQDLLSRGTFKSYTQRAKEKGEREWEKDPRSVCMLLRSAWHSWRAYSLPETYNFNFLIQMPSFHCARRCHTYYYTQYTWHLHSCQHCSDHLGNMLQKKKFNSASTQGTEKKNSPVISLIKIRQSF